MAATDSDTLRAEIDVSPKGPPEEGGRLTKLPS
jgi:hypothetical protein